MKGIQMGKKISSFIESIVILAIFLVLVHTFLEDFAALAGWNMGVRKNLIVAGCLFDLFFSIEFLVRLYYAIVGKRVAQYLTVEKGWIDFLASIPLLILNSGPTAIALLSQGTALVGIGGFLGILKVVKSIRIARVLRFLRILKIFKKIKNTDSPMAQRHVATITTICITILVFSLFAYTIAKDLFSLPGFDSAFLNRQQEAVQFLANANDDRENLQERIDQIADTNRNILIVKHNGQTIFTQYSNSFYQDFFGPGDYAYVKRGSMEIFYDLRPQIQHMARDSLFFFSMVILLVLAFMLIYSPHFAISVTDPIHVMKRGFEEQDYNLEVKLSGSHQEDDIFQLAALYNEIYLPLKDRNVSQEDSPKLEMNIDDIMDMME